MKQTVDALNPKSCASWDEGKPTKTSHPPACAKRSFSIHRTSRKRFGCDKSVGLEWSRVKTGWLIHTAGQNPFLTTWKPWVATIHRWYSRWNRILRFLNGARSGVRHHPHGVNRQIRISARTAIVWSFDTGEAMKAMVRPVKRL